MLHHPWIILAEYLKENWYTQKDFSKKIGKKTSEINELIRGKRNITVARDIVLTKYLSTKPKFWILKQVDFDYEQALIKNWENDLTNNNENWQGINQNISMQKTLQDIIDEENLQSKYLKENVFQETPMYEEKEKNKIEDNKIVQETKNIPIIDLLKEDPITENSPLSELFDSF